MRVAILSAMETLSGGALMPRGFVRIGGRTVLQRQLEFALDAGCERIACLSNDLPSELIELQHAAEKDGAKFQIIRDIRPLSGLVNATDEILILADGLAFEPELAEQLLGQGKRILTLPADGAVELGFERLDRGNAWAGIFLASGALIEKLSEMPADVDPQSSLLRLALQSGIRTTEVPSVALFDHHWKIIDSDDAGEEFEAEWLRTSTSPVGFMSPIRAFADRAALSVLRRHTRPEKAVHVVEAVSIGMLAVSAGAALLDYPIVGLLAIAVAGFLGQFCGTLSGVLQGRDGQSRIRGLWSYVQPILLDLLLISLTVIAVPTRHRVEALFAVFVAVGLVRLIESPVAKVFTANFREMLTDRSILALFLVAGLALGNITLFLQIFAAALLSFILLWYYWPKLTRA